MDQATLSKRILVVDDNNEAADLSCELLELYGYQTAVAYSGAQGLEKAMHFMPHVILLDLGMAGMDGYQVAAAIRALPELCNVGLVAFTAWGDAATRARAREAGFDQHITKPAGLDDILNAINATFAMRAAHAEAGLKMA